MDIVVRRHLTFDCDGSALVGTIDEADRGTGLLIVSGGNEIRSGAHRGMATLAQDVAQRGYPVFRFDRRGVGDSEGENRGYAESAADIAAAIAAFRCASPAVERIVGFGNCDAATALVLHDCDVDARILANPWIVEAIDTLPPAAAIRRHYVQRLRDPRAWAALLSGKIDMKAAARGLGRIAGSRTDPTPLAETFASRVARRPTTIVLAARDNTAIAFADAWKNEVFAHPRAVVRMVRFDSASHSFATDADEAALRKLLLETLAGQSPG